jgi:hypothetical protein
MRTDPSYRPSLPYRIRGPPVKEVEASSVHEWNVETPMNAATGWSPMVLVVGVSEEKSCRSWPP